MFSVVPSTLRILLLSLLWSQREGNDPSLRPLKFQLRHLHAVTNDSRVVFSNVPPSFTDDVYQLDTSMIRAHKPPSFSAFTAARVRSARFMQSESLKWHEVDVRGPKIDSRETLLQLAQMTSNSYNQPGDKEWYDLGSGWNGSFPFGWEPDADGFRGHLFMSEDNSTVVISVKGTSAGWMVGGGGPTVKKDKLNDNLLFSCCCARVGPTWSTVCDCYSGGYKCEQECVENALIEESLFYSVGINLYNNVSYMYPNADIWVIGHSLGGAIASLIGATFGVPVVAFEAPGERMAARRLHLPSPPSMDYITHIYHTADPIPMGACTGVSSVCALGGYALESKCHLGRTMLYDTVSTLGWSVDSRTHGIKVIIERLLVEWEGEMPTPQPEDNCTDCFQWEYI